MAAVVPFGLCRIVKGTETGSGRAEKAPRAAIKEGGGFFFFSVLLREEHQSLPPFFSNVRLGFFPVFRRIFKATLEGVWSNLG